VIWQKYGDIPDKPPACIFRVEGTRIMQALSGHFVVVKEAIKIQP
jgi:hypothetical protein